MKQAGKGAYEVSNYAQKGFECRHNMTYWTGKDYAGIGPSACGRIDGYATSNARWVNEWMKTPMQWEKLTPKERQTEKIIMGLRLFHQGFPKKESLPKLFHLMEVISFRYKLINSRADIRGRLNDLIRTFDGDVELLSREMKAKMEEAYYWSDRKFVEILNGAMYQKGRTNPLTIYFLWEYEQYLQRKGYIISGKIKIADENIEHISPQTEPDEKVTSGYEIDETGFYTKEFRENYINKLGNLMLISQSHNSSIGNNPFKDKLKSYIENPILRQQAHIKDFVADMKNPVWDSKSIDLRHDEMLKFACKRWSFNI